MKRGEMMLRLKDIRKKRGFTQKDIAKIINVNQTQVHRMENEKCVINHKQIIKLCEALDVRADDLLGIDKKKED
jgi:transcriptional regulator with XRE-family HTH domain